MKDRRRTVFWGLLVSSLCAFALSMGYRWFERGGAFDLDTVRVRGIRNADSSVVCQAVEPLFGTSIWQIDIEVLQDRLSRIPGIDSARVRREPLRTLILELQVSEPSFVICDSSGKTAVSTLGEVLPERFMSDTLPVVEVLSPIDPQVTRGLARWFSGGDMKGDGLLFSFSHDGVSVLVDEERRVLLGREDLGGRWCDYLLLSSSMGSGGNLLEVDMRYSGQAVLRTDAAGPEGEVVQ